METLIITRKYDVKVIRLNKPKKKNAIDCNMYIEIKKQLDSAAADESISMVVLRGTGDFYCSGNELGVNNLEADREILYESVKNFIKAIILFPKLLVAVVNGPAIGVAVTTLPFCDFVYASDKAYFYTPFTKLGIVAEACSSMTFPQMMGNRLARKMLMLNYKMPAQEALNCGLVTEVYKQEELDTKAWENIKNILSLPQDSVLATKQLIQRPHLRQFLETNEMEIQELKRLAQSKL